MNTILVPLDGSVRAEQALPYARRLALLLDARMYLLRVVPDVQEDELFSTTIADVYFHSQEPPRHRPGRAWQSWEIRRQHASGYLSSHAVMLQSDGVRVDFDVRLGNPAEEILAVADEQRAAMIAMATHGYSGIKRWTLGGVTDKVACAARSPVFVVRSGEPERQPVSAFKRIIVPLDGSTMARAALPPAVDLAKRAQAEIVLLRAIAPTMEGVLNLLRQPMPHYGAVLPILRAQATRELSELAEDLRRQDLAVATVVENGPAAEVIVEQAARRQADLIVMCSHGYSGIKRWALGSTADKVLHAAQIPLLLMRSANERPADGAAAFSTLATLN